MGQILTHVLHQILTHGASSEIDTQYCISNGSATFRPRFFGQKLTQNLGQVLTTKTKSCWAAGWREAARAELSLVELCLLRNYTSEVTRARKVGGCVEV